QALTFAELTDYLRDYRECAEHYSSTGRLEVYEELQGLLDRLGEQGVTLRYATRSLLEAGGQDHPLGRLPDGNVLYLVGFLDGEAPDELALPRKMI
ncbi:XRE family transcriptional regulator, partial [Pseudomonas aeruginosa]